MTTNKNDGVTVFKKGIIDSVTNEYWGTMPSQKVSSKTKEDKDWQRATANAIIGQSNQSASNGRTSKYQKMVNYNLVNSKFDENDLKYVTNPYNIPNTSGELPARMHLMNIIRPKLELLIGEEIRRPFKFNVIGVGGEVINAKDTVRKQQIREVLEQDVLAILGQPQTDEQGNPIPQPKLEEVLKDFDENYYDVREQWSAAILKEAMHKNKLEFKFNEGFEHALISAEEIYYVSISGGDPKVRVTNPVNFWCHKTPDMRNIQDSEMAVETRYMAKGEILDEFGPLLDNSDLEKLDGGNFTTAFNGTPAGFYENENTGNNNSDYGQNNQYQLFCFVWKSWQKIGFLTYIDENGEPQADTVDDTYKLTQEQKDAGWELDWEWKPQVWKGYRIGKDIYFGIEPLPNQVDGKLPYIGRIYNATNSESVSLVDLAKPYQYLYMIIWYRLEMEVAKAKGKKFVMDMAAIPRSMGIDTDKWMYYFDNLGIAFINSHEEGTEGASQGQVSKFNQYNAIDMSLSNSIVGYLNILDKLENGIGDITGVSRQREGQITSSETLGGVERAVNQSSYITEKWFYTHNEVKREVLSYYLELAKIAYIDGKTFHLMDDKMRSIVKVDGFKLNDSNYNVYISGSARDSQEKEQLMQLAQIAMQSGKANLSDMVKIIKSASISEVENTIIASEKGFIEDQMEQQRGQQESAERMNAANIQNQKEARQWEANEKQLDRDNDIRVAELKAAGTIGMNNPDMNQNGVPDIVEMTKLSLQDSKQQYDNLYRANEGARKNQEIEIKRQESENKKEVERLNIKEVQTQNKSQEKIAKMNDVVKKKELGLKSRELDLKEKEIEQKAIIEAMKIQSKKD